MSWAEVPDGQESPLNYAVQKRDQAVLDMVATAVRHREVVLAYQPVMEAQRTGRVAFYEGLIRVLDATGRVIPAAQFMPVVEDRPLGREIDCLALELGLLTLAEVPDLRLSINMSARSIGYPNWLRTLERGLMQDATIGARLILEITEGSAMTVPELVCTFMQDLRRRDVAFALDDFGAGATSFRYLRDFRFDLVKIDRQFCQNIQNSADNQLLVDAMIRIADGFDMMTVAEGVENQGAAQWLRRQGVHCLQGYHFAAPQLRPDWLPAANRRKVG